jgi:hypothetical protein
MKNINDLRETLFETIQLIKTGKIDIEKAKAISELGQVIVNSAKAEVDFIKQTGGQGSGFIEDNPKAKLTRPEAKYSNNGHKTLLEKYS